MENQKVENASTPRWTRTSLPKTKQLPQNTTKKWNVELKHILSSIIGEKGVPLVCVVREDDDPKVDPTFTWEEKFEKSMVLAGPEHDIDRKTVHQIILRNVAEDFDAHAYIKPGINK